MPVVHQGFLQGSHVGSYEHCAPIAVTVAVAILLSFLAENAGDDDNNNDDNDDNNDNVDVEHVSKSASQ